MAEAADTTHPDAEQLELERLRARVAELEAQLHEQAARTNAIVARTQERVYWLDRWHLDLNAIMSRPGAALALRAVRPVRRSVRAVKTLARGRRR
jgi:hypothetical protein